MVRLSPNLIRFGLGPIPKVNVGKSSCLGRYPVHTREVMVPESQLLLLPRCTPY